MKLGQKRNCKRCLALAENSFCNLGFDNQLRNRFGYLEKPLEPCPKPLTKKDLLLCKTTEGMNKLESTR